MNCGETKPAPSEGLSRRAFLRIGAKAGAATALAGAVLPGCLSPTHPSPTLFQSQARDRIRIGFVGVGNMGTSHVRNLLSIEGVELKAVCDIVEEKVARAQKMAVDAGQPSPTGYSKGERDFVRMCESEDLDLVYTATPWQWHVPVCVAAMENGKHAATEVPASITLEGCWQLVEASERFGKHCVMMENCCYDRPEMMILNMVRKGLLGEIIHGECGYGHDARALLLGGSPEGQWRLAHSVKRNANLYPTHGLGPVAQCMDINRGDRFDYLVSMSSASKGLSLYAREAFGPEDIGATQKVAVGDVNVSLIRTMKGRTLTLVYDCSSPRPYSRMNLVQGTRGIAQRWPERIYVEGRSPDHEWELLEAYAAEYDHPLWKEKGSDAAGAGHGGMDYLEDLRLIQCLRTGSPMDMDVYDAASWSAACELSERSTADRSRPQDFPDFTRGAWPNRPRPEGM